MAFCLPPEFSEKFKTALKEGQIVPEQLSGMTSAERRAYFEKIVGTKEAAEVNAMYESKLLLLDQKRGLVSWAKKVAGITEETRRDLLSKIERMENVLDASSKEEFLADLATKKIGADITFEQAQNVVKMAKETASLKLDIPIDSPLGSKERLAYGLQYTKFQDYIRHLKGNDQVVSFKEWLKNPAGWLESATGLTKSLLSSLDNSFFGRQGVKILYTNPTLWMRGFLKSFKDIGKEAFGVDKSKTPLESLSKGIDAMQAIKAEIYSRPNALNGKYDKAKIDIGINSEEAFPSSLPGRIPILGRLYNASESAFQGAALRMRADYADRLIALAEKNGVNMRDRAEASQVGRVVNSSTGRGNIGGLDKYGKTINALAFSIKFLKSNIDTLTAHGAAKGLAADIVGKLGGSKPTYSAGQKFARQTAAKNLLRITGTLATIYFTANLLNPGSVELDPRSSKFGKIKIGNVYIDPTGGMGSLVTLASRLTPTLRNGKWGFWYKSATTGKWTDLTAGKYGQLDATDILENFGEGKLSPLAGLARDVWKGKNFQGDKVTPQNALQSLLTPLPIQSGTQINKVQPIDTPEGLSALILEGLGFSSSTYAPKK